MSLIGIKKPGEKINTPNLSKAIDDDLRDKAELDKSLAANWKATPEVTPCGVCNGSGYDEGMVCMGCDGSGTDFELHYGCEDGKWYAYIVQYGLDGLKKYCEARREAEVDGIRANQSMLGACAMPKFLQMELTAKGMDVQKMIANGQTREIVNHVSQNYPWLMYTNLKSF